MNKYCVSYMSYFDNDVKMCVVMADSEIAAMKQVVNANGYDVEGDGTIDEFIGGMFDCDVAINVLVLEIQ